MLWFFKKSMLDFTCSVFFSYSIKTRTWKEMSASYLPKLQIVAECIPPRNTPERGQLAFRKLATWIARPSCSTSFSYDSQCLGHWSPLRPSFDCKWNLHGTSDFYLIHAAGNSGLLALWMLWCFSVISKKMNKVTSSKKWLFHLIFLLSWQDLNLVCLYKNLL
jgi:hypothetical protein